MTFGSMCCWLTPLFPSSTIWMSSSTLALDMVAPALSSRLVDALHSSCLCGTEGGRRISPSLLFFFDPLGVVGIENGLMMWLEMVRAARDTGSVNAYQDQTTK